MTNTNRSGSGKHRQQVTQAIHGRQKALNVLAAAKGKDDKCEHGEEPASCVECNPIFKNE